YSQTLTSFQLIGLTLIMYNNAFGYQGLLMARDKEKILSVTSLGALLLNIILAYILAKVLHVNFSQVIICTLITYFIYVTVLTYIGRKSLQLDTSMGKLLKDAHDLKILIP